MKIGQFGCGRWGSNVYRTLSGLKCSMRVYDPDMSDETYHDVVAHADAFVVCTPAPTHADVVSDLLSHGKPVFVEKPMALTSEEARSISGVSMVGFLMLYHPAFKELAKRVEGEPIRFMQGVRYGGTVREEGPYWSLSTHDVAMALALDPECSVSLDATFDSPRFRARRFTVLADRQYSIDHDDLFVDNTRVEVSREEPLKAEMRAFLRLVSSGRPVIPDGAFGVEVTKRLESYLEDSCH
jgi:predicted dehydrogenase